MRVFIFPGILSSLSALIATDAATNVIMDGNRNWNIKYALGQEIDGKEIDGKELYCPCILPYPYEMGSTKTIWNHRPPPQHKVNTPPSLSFLSAIASLKVGDGAFIGDNEIIGHGRGQTFYKFNWRYGIVIDRNRRGVYPERADWEYMNIERITFQMSEDGTDIEVITTTSYDSIGKFRGYRNATTSIRPIKKEHVSYHPNTIPIQIPQHHSYVCTDYSTWGRYRSTISGIKLQRQPIKVQKYRERNNIPPDTKISDDDARKAYVGHIEFLLPECKYSWSSKYYSYPSLAVQELQKTAKGSGERTALIQYMVSEGLVRCKESYLYSLIDQPSLVFLQDSWPKSPPFGYDITIQKLRQEKVKKQSLAIDEETTIEAPSHHNSTNNKHLIEVETHQQRYNAPHPRKAYVGNIEFLLPDKSTHRYKRNAFDKCYIYPDKICAIQELVKTTKGSAERSALIHYMVDRGLVVCKKTCLYEMLNIVERYKDGLEYIEKRKEWPREWPREYRKDSLKVKKEIGYGVVLPDTTYKVGSVEFNLPRNGKVYTKREALKCIAKTKKGSAERGAMIRFMIREGYVGCKERCLYNLIRRAEVDRLPIGSDDWGRHQSDATKKKTLVDSHLDDKIFGKLERKWKDWRGKSFSIDTKDSKWYSTSLSEFEKNVIRAKHQASYESNKST